MLQVLQGYDVDCPTYQKLKSEIKNEPEYKKLAEQYKVSLKELIIWHFSMSYCFLAEGFLQISNQQDWRRDLNGQCLANC